MLRKRGMASEGKRVVVSGSGNVAIYAAQKAMELGAQGSGHERQHRLDRTIKDGVDLAVVKQIKEVERAPPPRVCAARARAPIYTEGSHGIWTHALRYRPALRHAERIGLRRTRRR